MLRRPALLKPTALAVVVIALNAALWWTIRTLPSLKDQINWFMLWAIALIGVGVVAIIVDRRVDKDEKAVARAGLGGVALLQFALIAGVFYWQGTTDRRAPTIPKAILQITDDSPVGTRIGHIKVDGGNTGKLNYEIIAEHNDGSYNFKLNASTGELTLARTEMMNARQWPMFQLHVRVTDAFNQSGEGYVWVRVIDVNQPPRAP